MPSAVRFYRPGADYIGIWIASGSLLSNTVGFCFVLLEGCWVDLPISDVPLQERSRSCLDLQQFRQRSPILHQVR